MLSCILLGIQQYRNPWVSQARLALTEAILPLVQTMNKPFEAIAFYLNYFQSQQQLVDENLKLKAQNEFLIHQHNQVRYHASENQRLRQALNVKEVLTDEVIAAPVIHKVFDGFSNEYFVKLTAKDGINKNNPVLTTQGYLCGRIVEVGVVNSYFIPITDVSSRVPVMVERTREQGVLAGESELSLSLLHVENRNNIQVGDRLITSGNGGIFPPGIPVAIVAEISNEGITAHPIATSKDLDFVLIIT
jgi:rod shape-determining protein MreC